MTRDLVYVFNKITKKSSLLGELQSDFDMSLVIDGTKDSAKALVLSFDGVEIEPYSIILHKKTFSWWVVSHDKVERYQNDNGDFLYTHNLDLLGAIELLNARDLTDCGFNDNDYTVNDFIWRLFTLSNIEYEVNISADNNFKNKVVDFIKTFENYTLLSALREFLDAYNMCPKLSFSTSYNSTTDVYTLSDMTLTIIPKTGNRSRVHQMSEFDDVRETKTMDKNSFGTTVVSNAENVISSKAKTFPANGSVKLNSTEYLIVENDTLNNGVIRLPSKVFKGNWIKLLYRVLAYIIIDFGGGTTRTQQLHYYAMDYQSLDKLIQDVKNFVFQTLTTPEEQQAFNNFITSHKEELRQKLDGVGCVTIYDGNKLVPTYSGGSAKVEIQKGDNVPYLAKFHHSGKDSEMVFVDKETRDCLPDTHQGIAWERGSNLITGFDFLSSTNGGFTTITTRTVNTDYMSNERHLLTFTWYNLTITISLPEDDGVTYEQIKMSVGALDLATQIKRLSFIVNYYPMTDLKIKIDNQRDKKDIQLYNQNGRFTDCVALSKLLNSYSKEISSDTITRYAHYYYSQGAFFGVLPNVGDIVMNGNEEYVITNLSMNFTQNESNVENDFGYFIECEITMSKWVSTKSLMVNPNSNIRDYGIPQNFNVKRKQLYRDYYEFSYQAFSDADNNPYLPTTYILPFTHLPNLLSDFMAVMKLTYRGEVENSTTWYYQLETTNYYLNKMISVVLDFNDNNIIGYGAQNVFSGFDVSRIFTGMTDSINTPISYVDDHGWFSGISIKLLTNEQITNVYNTYQESSAGGSSYEGCLYNYSVLIPHEIYDWLGSGDYAILINENGYYKDALEIPVFEYVCQIDDSEYVLIGDNILEQHDGFIYFYSYVNGNNINQNNAFTTTRVVYNSDNGTYVLSLACEFSFDNANHELSVSIWDYCSYNPSTGLWEFGTRNSYRNGDDYAIFRHAYNVNTGEEIIDLMFIAKKVPHSGTSNLVLKVNHYKLK